MEAEKIKFLLAATGLSSKQAGDLLGFSAITVRSWCSGARNVPAGAVEQLCEYYENMSRWASRQSWPVVNVKTDEEAQREGFQGVNSYRIAASMVFLTAWKKKSFHKSQNGDRNRDVPRSGGDEPTITHYNRFALKSSSP